MDVAKNFIRLGRSFEMLIGCGDRPQLVPLCNSVYFERPAEIFHLECVPLDVYEDTKRSNITRYSTPIEYEEMESLSFLTSICFLIVDRRVAILLNNCTWSNVSSSMNHLSLNNYHLSCRILRV